MKPQPDSINGILYGISEHLKQITKLLSKEKQYDEGPKHYYVYQPTTSHGTVLLINDIPINTLEILHEHGRGEIPHLTVTIPFEFYAQWNRVKNVKFTIEYWDKDVLMFDATCELVKILPFIMGSERKIKLIFEILSH